MGSAGIDYCILFFRMRSAVTTPAMLSAAKVKDPGSGTAGVPGSASTRNCMGSMSDVIQLPPASSVAAHCDRKPAPAPALSDVHDQSNDPVGALNTSQYVEFGERM